MTLEEIFASAESSGIQLKPWITATDEAERETAVARANQLPDISLTASVSYIGDGFTTARNYSDYQRAPIPHLGTGLGVTVSQPVYAGGAILNGIKLAELKNTAARYTADLHRTNLRFRLTGFYLDIYKCHNLKAVVEANIAAAEKVLEQMRSRHEQGTALHNDITRYELLVSNLRLQLTHIVNTMNILNHDLVTTAGLPEGTYVVPDTTILAGALPVDGEAQWQQEAAANSPQLKLAANSVEISKKAIDLAKSERRPKVAIQAGWTMDGPILVEVPPINRNLSYWYIGVGLNYNLSSLFKSNKSIAKAEVAKNRAAEELDARTEDLRMAVRADYIHYLEAYDDLKTRTKSLELATDNYRITSMRYSADMALLTDMLDAANARLDAEQQLVNARIDILYYYYKLLFTSGKI